MKKITFLALFLMSSIVIFPQSRIIGGTNVLISEKPYQVSIQNTDGHFCGGALIDSVWVLTGAHCVYDKLHEDLLIYTGISSLSNKVLGQQKKVIQILTHSNFNINSLENDLALLKLESPVEISLNTKPINLVSPEDEQNQLLAEGTEAEVSGWGDTLLGNESSYPDRLQAVAVTIISNEKANELNVYNGRVKNTNIVAGDLNGGKDACQGDSGGPLTVKKGDTDVLAGIVSWGEGCANTNKPGVYTKISAYYDWIQQYINPPIANFQLESFYLSDSSMYVINKSQNADHYQWLIKSENIKFTSTKKDFLFIPEEPGDYKVQLIAKNDFTADTLEKIMTVFRYKSCTTLKQEGMPLSGTFKEASSDYSIAVFQDFELEDSVSFYLEEMEFELDVSGLKENSGSRVYIDIYNDDYVLLNDLRDYFIPNTADGIQQYMFDSTIFLNSDFKIEFWMDEFYDNFEGIEFGVVQSSVSKAGFTDPTAGDSYFYESGNNYNLDITLKGCLLSNQNIILKVDDNFATDLAGAEVFPNPTTGKLSVKQIHHAEAQLFSSTGEKVTSFQLEKGMSVLDLTQLKNGIYFLRWENNVEKIVLLK